MPSNGQLTSRHSNNLVFGLVDYIIERTDKYAFDVGSFRLASFSVGERSESTASINDNVLVVGIKNDGSSVSQEFPILVHFLASPVWKTYRLDAETFRGVTTLAISLSRSAASRWPSVQEFALDDVYVRLNCEE